MPTLQEGLRRLIAALLLGLTAGTTILPDLTPQTVVLTYHDMIEQRDSKALWFDCTPQELEEQLDWLTTKGASFISIDQLYKHLTRAEPLPSNPVLISFADNYLGFYTKAWPILKRRNIPVVQFVHTDFVGNKQGRPKMSWTQLKELDASGLVTIASQTRSHPADLTKLSDRQLKEEFSGSKDALEKQLGHPTSYVAYPNGKFEGRVATIAAAAGYKMAFTEEQTPAEASPSVFMVARYVHTKYKDAFPVRR